MQVGNIVLRILSPTVFFHNDLKTFVDVLAEDKKKYESLSYRQLQIKRCYCHKVFKLLKFSTFKVQSGSMHKGAEDKKRVRHRVQRKSQKFGVRTARSEGVHK